MKVKNLKIARSIILFGGVIVSWSTTISSFVDFYQLEGTIFKIKDCMVPNPVTTPCFWGALAFVGAFLWSLKRIINERYMLYFLIFSFLFAWTNFAIELKGVTPKEGALIAPCPAGGRNPFTSACFFGSILFTLGLITSYFVLKNSKQKDKKELKE
jgi:hypothetical protein